jgi:hypothetical protein
MSEPNPYDPPQSPQPRQIVKRGLGVGAILLLTPVAVGIAAAGSCAAVFPVVDATPRGAYFLAFVLGWSVFLIPPALTLIAMLWWATRRHRQLKVAAIKAARPDKWPGLKDS